MEKKHNFGAGPCILPVEVTRQAAEAVINWNGSGLSILEVSHRSKEFEKVMDKTRTLIKELLQVPKDYHILFMQGGASTQFSMIPLNFLAWNKPAIYLNSGFFAQKAIKEARHFGEVEIIATSEDKSYRYIPDHYSIPEDAAYFHCTSNNTIEGTQMKEFPKSPIPICCDMSSDIGSRKINIRDFDLIYAGAQKNLGPAGLTIVIISEALLNNQSQNIPAMWDYRIYRDHKSLYNTPAVFSIYATMLNLTWIKGQGGVEEMEKRNTRKAKMLYEEIDRNPLFQGTANIAHRSNMNVTFKMETEELEKEFLDYAENKGMVGIKCFPTQGGFRVSLYNALPLSSVMELIHCMSAFQQKKKQQISK
ncbi:3-phosphoserine/phosphohydroxythreonine transaminase [Pedobacter aquatilis]|uniref:3-phosphoserine/phosphohydroxythreonine transaminase n=1 Tax=Pedobacter aquatilis TaxID=351343 RepID=UPI00292E8DFE|nr:3-phosphoserine/phosphohydroxythreonine transaminase [Pedobacter aquatilis]